MSAPRVQYVRTPDGFDIAYTISGSGPSLLFLPFLWSHAQLVWDDPQRGPLLAALAMDFTVVHYDGRGQGLSQRGLPPGYSMEDRRTDLSTVVSHLSLSKVVLVADASACHVAVNVAAQEPHLVQALALLRGTVSLSERWNTFASLAEKDWNLFLELGGRSEGGDENLVTYRHASMTQADFLLYARALTLSEIDEMLPRVAAPAVVIHSRRVLERWHTEQAAAQMASLLPRGRLAVVDGTGLWGNPEETATTIRSVLVDPPKPHGTMPSQPQMSRRQREVLRLIAGGRSNQQIADELVISPNTVQNHIKTIYRLANLTNRAQAAIYARDSGLI